MNSVNVIGRLVKPNEPKSYNSQNGNGTVLKNTIAIRGKKKDESYFVDFTAWGKAAEYLAQYSGKGDKIAISGELIQEIWQDAQTGQNRSKISINAISVEILSTAQNNQTQNNQQSQYNQPQYNQGQFNQQPQYNQQGQFIQPQQPPRQQPQQPPESYGNYDTMPAEVQQAVDRHNASYNQTSQNIISEDEIPF